ncbi:NADH-quinone oxidoreductase subunit M [Acidobacteria bacterium AH-259-O06]|nr:NADH-quinone oxidoreductase subunit M [Acidobacteria bacterium AH-259-O06]
MSFFMENILNFVCFFPLIGVVLIVLWPKGKEHENGVKWVANIVALIGFLISIPLITAFNDPRYIDTATGMRFVIRKSWIDAIGAQYYFAIDGISLLLVLLTTLLGFIAILSSWSAITERVREYYCYFLILQVGMLGVFMAFDFFLFYVFWEVMLVPMYFIIGVWGGPRKLYAAIKFFLYTLAGSVLLLLGILALYFYQHSVTGVWSFDILGMQQLSIPLELQQWIFLALFFGFAIKVPMFPFHTWLPDAHVEAPTAGSVILAAILLKMGTYGFVRLSLPILPEATMEFLPWLLVLSVIGIIYGALVAMMQKDMKKLVAYSSVSHLGFCMLGVFVATPVALEGGILQMINHGISTGALFLIVGIIYERRHTRMIADYGGLSHIMPVFATVFLIMTLSSIGMPTLNGFIGEFMVLQGVFADPIYKLWALFGVLGIVLGAAYMLWLYQRVMFGELDDPENRNFPDLNWRELATFVPLIILAFWIGLYPKTFLDYLHAPVNQIVERVRPGEFPLLPVQVAVKE